MANQLKGGNDAHEEDNDFVNGKKAPRDFYGEESEEEFEQNEKEEILNEQFQLREEFN